MLSLHFLRAHSLMTKEACPKVAGKLWAAEKEVGTEYAFIPQMHSEQGRSQRGTVRGRCRLPLSVKMTHTEVPRLK